MTDFELRAHKALAITEIENLMSRHIYYHAADMNREEVTLLGFEIVAYSGDARSKMLDALKAVPDDHVILELSNGLSPIVLTPAEGGAKFAYMVLPVRLKAE